MGKKSESGQGLLIVIMLMVVGLTIGLAVASRSFVAQKNTTNETESQKAYSAAEAGVEKALAADCTPGGAICDVAKPLGNGSSIKSVTVVPIKSDTFSLHDTQGSFSQDEGADIWFAPHNGTAIDYSSPRWKGNMSITWDGSGGGSSCNNTAAMEIIIVYASATDPPTNVFTKTTGYDPCSRGNNQLNNSGIVNNFSVSSINGVDPLFAKVVPLYQSATNVKVHILSSDTNFPDQGSLITSVGVSGNTQHTVQVTNNYPSYPSEYFYSLLVPGQ